MPSTTNTVPPGGSAGRSARATGREASGNDPITVGLVPSPGLAEDIANDISQNLADDLSQQIDVSAPWDVHVRTNPLSGTDTDSPDLFEALGSVDDANAWDYAIAITDIPFRRDGQIVIASSSNERCAAWISIPALGPFALRRRTRELVIQLVHDLCAPQENDDSGRAIDPGVARRAATTSEGNRYVAPGILGQARLVGGMVYANKPWNTFPSFKKTGVTAVATGSYGLIFTSLWELGAAYTVWRLTGLMLLAMTILATWIITTHRLWQHPAPAMSGYLTTLYNVTTIVTIASGVIFAYVLIYIMLLIESAVFMPPSLLESKIQQPVGPLNYAAAAWVTASVATLAGALGASLEDTAAVRRATFGWRQRQRLESYERAVSDDKGQRQS